MGKGNRAFSTRTTKLGDIPLGLQKGLRVLDSFAVSKLHVAQVVWQNCSQPLFPSTPFGGRAGKKSGFGHELGKQGLEEYINVKTVIAASGGFSWQWYGN